MGTAAMRCSELHTRAQTKDRNRPPVPVVGRVVDELIVDRQMGEGGYGDTVVCFQDLLGTRIWQLAIAENPAKTAGREIQLTLLRDSVDCASQPHRVIRPPPARAG